MNDQDAQDYKYIAELFAGRIYRCSECKHLTMEGYLCHNCKHDSSYDREECNDRIQKLKL